MTDEQRKSIRRAYLRGDPPEKIAAWAGVTVAEVNAYLASWCDRGCPRDG